jgi:ankyrin repeat protein
MLNLRRPMQLLFVVMMCFAGVPVAGATELSDFFVAVQVDNPVSVKSLIARGVDPNARDPRSGETALIIALREDSMNVFNALLSDPRVELELAAPNGNTALMMAAFKANKPAALALLGKGAAVNRSGWSPLHYAAAGGAADIAGILIGRGAALNARAPAGLTALMMAAREGQEAAAAVLLRAGADASLVNSDGLTALQLAERADKPRIVKAIQAHLRTL